MKIVAYYRVSTRRQANSGLGLEGQRIAVVDFAEQKNGQIIREYVEVESGRRKDRPELERAIAHAKRARAKLVVAKLDRLARNVAFTSALMESKVDFVAGDNPHATKFNIHILAAVAELEAEQISQRTVDALAAAKKRGTKLGSARPGHWNGREERRRAGAKTGAKAAAVRHKKDADDFYEFFIPIVADHRRRGLSCQQIADKLNDTGETTRRGAAWNRVQIGRVLKRADHWTGN